MASQGEISQSTSGEHIPPTQQMLERVFALAMEVLGNEASVLAWLKTPHRVWGKSPVLMMQTRQGLAAVEQELEGLSHGIY